MFSNVFSSEQEELVFYFSKFVLGPQALFSPLRYGHNRQPADLAWVLDRCAFLFYMTRSGATFEKKRKHNLRQLFSWLRAWRSGQPLRGTVEDRHYSFNYHDVDHVVALSIIDGGEVGCEYHQDIVDLNAKDFKLSACATLPERAIHYLAKSGSGPLDVLHLLSHLKLISVRSNEDEVISMIGAFVSQSIKNAAKPFPDLPEDFRVLANALNCLDATLRGVRDLNIEGMPVTSDITLEDKLWFSFAFAALSSNIADVGHFGRLGLRAKRLSGIYALNYFIFANSTVLNREIDQVRTIVGTDAGLLLIHILDAGKDSPWAICVPLAGHGPSHMHQAAARLRDS
jgi:hypothetical protein